MNRVTVKLTPPPPGTGTTGYRGQDEYSRKRLGRLLGTACVTDAKLPDLLRIAGREAHALEVLPDRDTPAGRVPECEEF